MNKEPAITDFDISVDGECLICACSRYIIGLIDDDKKIVISARDLRVTPEALRKIADLAEGKTVNESRTVDSADAITKRDTTDGVASHHPTPAPIGKVKIKRLYPDAKLPEYMSEGAVCMDCYAHSKEDVEDGYIKYGLGFEVELPPGYKLAVYARSSVYKRDMRLSNSVGQIDIDYRGEVSAVFSNISWFDKAYNIGERVCQIAIEPAPKWEWEEVDELTPTKRGDGAYGSTDK